MKLAEEEAFLGGNDPSRVRRERKSQVKIEQDGGVVADPPPPVVVGLDRRLQDLLPRGNVIDQHRLASMGLVVAAAASEPPEEEDAKKNSSSSVSLLSRLLRPLTTRKDAEAAIRHKDLLQALQNPQGWYFYIALYLYVLRYIRMRAIPHVRP